MWFIYAWMCGSYLSRIPYKKWNQYFWKSSFRPRSRYCGLKFEVIGRLHSSENLSDKSDKWQLEWQKFHFWPIHSSMIASVILYAWKKYTSFQHIIRGLFSRPIQSNIVSIGVGHPLPVGENLDSPFNFFLPGSSKTKSLSSEGFCHFGQN